MACSISGKYRSRQASQYLRARKRPFPFPLTAHSSAGSGNRCLREPLRCRLGQCFRHTGAIRQAKGEYGNQLDDGAGGSAMD